VVGPLADDPYGMLGCYSFPSHIGRAHTGLALGVEIPTVLDALRSELPAATITYAAGCTVSDVDRDGVDRDGFEAALAAAQRSEVCVAVLGDRSGLFGLGTSGEGCDVADLRLPGVQAELLDALLATGTPVVLVLLSGRPYALGGYSDRLAAVVQAFFPGEEGGTAVAGVLAGRVCPSGRLPVGVPRDPGGQPASYLTTALGHATDVSTVDPTPLFPFGHGLSYTAFEWSGVDTGAVHIPTDGELDISLTVRNTGDRAGADIVQLYLHDPVGQVTRPSARLIGYARVPLAAGQARQVTFHVHADLASYTGRSGQRIVEPGDLELRLAASSVDVRAVVPVRLTGDERVVGHDRRLAVGVTLR
jgi:beta-xylosidase